MGAHDGGDGCVCDRLKYVEAALAEANITIVDRETLLVGAQKAYNKDLADLQAKLAAEKKDREDAQFEGHRLRAQLAAAEPQCEWARGCPHRTSGANRLAKKEARIAQLEKELAEAQETKGKYRKELSTLEASLAAAETDVRKLNEKLIAADKYWKGRIASLEVLNETGWKEVARLKDEFAAAQKALRTYCHEDNCTIEKRCSALEAATMDATKETEVLRKRNMELESQLTAAEEAIEALSPGGFYRSEKLRKANERIASLEKRLEHMTKAHDLIQQSLQKKKEEVESLRAGVSIMKVVNNDIMEISEGEKVQIPSILDWNLELYARRDTRVTILTREPSGAVIYRIEPRYPYMNYFEDVEFLGQELKGPMPKRLVDLLKELDFYKREVEGLRQGGAKVLEESTKLLEESTKLLKESTKLLKENEELKKESEEHLNVFRNETSLRIAEHEELERLRKMVK